MQLQALKAMLSGGIPPLQNSALDMPFLHAFKRHGQVLPDAVGCRLAVRLQFQRWVAKFSLNTDLVDDLLFGGALEILPSSVKSESAAQHGNICDEIL
jgi:hypothetical protein